MPIYEYQCLKCEKIHEVTHKISDLAPQKCPRCEGKLKKLVSLSSFALKGSGWYTTDYRRSAKSSAKEKEAPASVESCTPTGCAKPGCKAAD